MAPPRRGAVASASFCPPTPEALAPVYCLVGESRLEVDRALAAIRRAAHPDGGADLATDAFDAQSPGDKTELAARVVSAANTMPFLARRRLVIVRGVELLDGAAAETLIGYLASPSPSTCLVLLGDKADGRLKLFARLKKDGVLFSFDPPRDDSSARALVEREAQQRGVRFEPRALTALLEVVPLDAGELTNAVEQLSLYVAATPGRETRIGEDAVRAVLVARREHSIFELTDAIGQGSGERALRLLRALPPEDSAPVKVCTMLGRTVRQLMAAKTLPARASKFDAAQALGVPPFVAEKLLGQAGGFSAERLEQALLLVAETDRLLKSSRNDDDLLVDRMVLGMCALRARPSGPSASPARR